MSLDTAEAPKSEEARILCEKAEHLMEQIRTKQLKFNEKASTISMYHGQMQEDIPVDTYVALTMHDYDEKKVDIAELGIQLKKMSIFAEDRASLEKLANIAAHTKFILASNLLRAIDLAISKNALEEGEGYFSKLDECEKKNKATENERDQFRDECERLSTELISVRALYEDCERKRHIQPLGGKGQTPH